MEVASREGTLRARHANGDLDGAMTEALALYADELFGFLVGLSGDRVSAEDVFSTSCERIWRSLRSFRWECSFRVWAYRIARNEFLRSLRQVKRERRTIPISELPSIQQAVERARSSTPMHERTDTRDRFASLRARLDPEDHMLLGLRIDRHLSWADVAKVLADDEREPTARELTLLRKRFERLKTRLRVLLREAVDT